MKSGKIFSQKLLELQDKQQTLYDKVGQVEEAKAKIETLRLEQVAMLEKVAHLTKEEAQEKLFERLKKTVKKHWLHV